MPGAVHPQVRVQGEPALDPGEQVLAAGGDLVHGAPGEVGGGELRDPEVAAGQRPPGQRVVQPACGEPDRVAFGHGASVTRLAVQMPARIADSTRASGKPPRLPRRL